MTKEALKDLFTVLKLIDVKLTPQEKAVACYLLQARASRREKAAERTITKKSATKKSTTAKKEAKANAN